MLGHKFLYSLTYSLSCRRLGSAAADWVRIGVLGYLTRNCHLLIWVSIRLDYLITTVCAAIILGNIPGRLLKLRIQFRWVDACGVSVESVQFNHVLVFLELEALVLLVDVRDYELGAPIARIVKGSLHQRTDSRVIIRIGVPVPAFFKLVLLPKDVGVGNGACYDSVDDVVSAELCLVAGLRVFVLGVAEGVIGLAVSDLLFNLLQLLHEQFLGHGTHQVVELLILLKVQLTLVLSAAFSSCSCLLVLITVGCRG